VPDTHTRRVKNCKIMSVTVVRPINYTAESKNILHFV